MPATIVGVLEPGSHYAGTQRAELYANYPTNAHYMGASMQNERVHRMTDLYALVKNGVTLDRAQADVTAIASRLHDAYPADYPAARGFSMTLTPWREMLVRNARPTLLILMGAVGLVLLVACANVGNLTLARLVRRERELSVRAALGATPGQLRRQLLVEHLRAGRRRARSSGSRSRRSRAAAWWTTPAGSRCAPTRCSSTRTVWRSRCSSASRRRCSSPGRRGCPRRARSPRAPR